MSSIPGDRGVAGAAGVPSVAGTATDRPASQRHRRPLGNMVMHAPQILRALVRADEIWLVALAAVVGACAGVLVWFMTEVTQLIHQALFLISSTERLSAMVSLNPWRAVLVPSVGGLAFGVISYLIAKFRPRRSVDAIEANALFGGRMSLNDGIIVMLQTMM